MYFARSLPLLLAASSMVSAVPLIDSQVVKPDTIEERGKGGGGRGDADAAEALVQIVTGIIGELKKLSKDKQNEADYVKSTRDQLAAKYPKKNILLFHNQKSVAKLNGGTHTHSELPISFDRTKGYEIWVFDTGSFDLAGDGGELNWAFAGCVTNRNGGHIDFCQKS